MERSGPLSGRPGLLGTPGLVFWVTASAAWRAPSAAPRASVSYAIGADASCEALEPLRYAGQFIGEYPHGLNAFANLFDLSGRVLIIDFIELDHCDLG